MCARIGADQQRVVRLEAPLERLAQRGDLLAQLPLARGRRARPGRGAGDQRVEHVAPDLPRMSRGDAVELDPGVLERLLQPVDLAWRSWICALRYRVRSRSCPDRPGRHEARAHQPGLEQLAQPLGVLDVGLAAGDNQEHRLRELRPSLPGEVTVTAAHHPLVGARLAVEGRRRVGGVPCLIVRLPDGTPGTIEVQATSAGTAAGERGGGGVAVG